MQVAQHQPAHPSPAAPILAAMALPDDPGRCPAAMARYLRRTNGDAALCFARAMHEDAAWANEAWGSYWADVIRLV